MRQIQVVVKAKLGQNLRRESHLKIIIDANSPGKFSWVIDPRPEFRYKIAKNTSITPKIGQNLYYGDHFHVTRIWVILEIFPDLIAKKHVYTHRALGGGSPPDPKADSGQNRPRAKKFFLSKVAAQQVRNLHGC